MARFRQKFGSRYARPRPLWLRLVGVAIVPFLLACALGGLLVHDRVRASTRAAALQRPARAIAALTSAQRFIEDEAIGLFATDATSGRVPGATPAKVAARARTDAALSDPALRYAGPKVATLRPALLRARSTVISNQGDLLQLFDAYLGLLATTADAVDENLAVIEQGGAAFQEPAVTLSMAARVLVLSEQTLGEFFALASTPADGQAPIASLLRESYDGVLATISTTQLSPASRHAWQKILASPLVQLLGLVSDAGKQGAVTFTPSEIPAALAQAPQITKDINVQEDEATAEVLRVVEVQKAAAVRTAWMAVALAFVLGVLSFLVCGRAARRIRRPLVDLAERARSLSQGELVRGDEGVVTEIAVVSKAMNDAVDTLVRTADQADALARGALDHPSLTEVLPGAVGASLARSVGRVADMQVTLQTQASQDELTGLLNRRAGIELLETHLRDRAPGGPPVSLAYIDLDGFKRLNDFSGHGVGDAVLRATSRRLRRALVPGSHLCRLGGDELLLISTACAPGEVVELCRELQRRISAPVHSDDREFTVSASVGIAHHTPGETAAVLLSNADHALRMAKARGPGQLLIFDATMRDQVTRDTAMDAALRQAVHADGLHMHYQPVVDAHSGAIRSIEALLRWEMPGLGPVPPDVFIAIAEQSDLILEIDRWVLDAALRQLAMWQDHEVLGHCGLSINISARHLGRGLLVRAVRDALARHRIQGDRLVVEITETALARDRESVFQEFRELRSAGVRVAVDDFGTGYTSLSQLVGMPLDVLKIDRSFILDNVEQAEDDGIVAMVTRIAHRRGLVVVGEGVEEIQQLEWLQSLGCEQIQGYFFSRPLSPVALVQWLAHQPVLTPSLV